MKLEDKLDVRGLRTYMNEQGVIRTISSWKDTAMEIEPSQRVEIYEIYKIYQEVPEPEMTVEKGLYCLQSILDLIKKDENKDRLLTIEASYFMNSNTKNTEEQP